MMRHAGFARKTAMGFKTVICMGLYEKNGKTKYNWERHIVEKQWADQLDLFGN